MRNVGVVEVEGLVKNFFKEENSIIKLLVVGGLWVEGWWGFFVYAFRLVS